MQLMVIILRNAGDKRACVTIASRIPGPFLDRFKPMLRSTNAKQHRVTYEAMKIGSRNLTLNGMVSTGAAVWWVKYF